MNQRRTRVLLLSKVSSTDRELSRLFHGDAVEVILDKNWSSISYIRFCFDYYENKRIPKTWVARMQMGWRCKGLGMLMHYAETAGYDRDIIEKDGSAIVRFDPIRSKNL